MIVPNWPHSLNVLKRTTITKSSPWYIPILFVSFVQNRNGSFFTFRVPLYASHHFTVYKRCLTCLDLRCWGILLSRHKIARDTSLEIPIIVTIKVTKVSWRWIIWSEVNETNGLWIHNALVQSLFYSKRLFFSNQWNPPQHMN